MKEAGDRRGDREENLDVHNGGDCEKTEDGRDGRNRSPIDVKRNPVSGESKPEGQAKGGR